MADRSAVHQVAVLALPGMLALDFGIPVHAFDFDPYQVIVCGEGPVEDGQTHVVVSPPGGLEVLETADTVIVPGYFSPGDWNTGDLKEISLSDDLSTLDFQFWKDGYGPVLYHLTCTP